MSVIRTESIRVLIGMAVALWVTSFGVAAWVDNDTTIQKSVSEGVYSAAQADRGENIFGTICLSCHNPTEFTGDEFLNKWEGKPLLALFEVVKTTMPMDSPGTLKPEEYADVIGYVLRLNKFPAGDQELEGTDEAMKGIIVKKGG